MHRCHAARPKPHRLTHLPIPWATTQWSVDLLLRVHVYVGVILEVDAEQQQLRHERVIEHDGGVEQLLALWHRDRD